MVDLKGPYQSQVPHDSAFSHVSGESEFVDDRPPVRGELHVGLIWSPHAKARILRLHTEAALKVPGVMCVLSSKDVHHQNWGSIFEEQPFLASSEVNYVGEVIAVVAAQSIPALQAGIKAVTVDYDVMEAILSIDAAIAQKSFIGVARSIVRGDVAAELEKAPHKFSGRLILKGAEHFYLENQASIAYPREDGQIEIHSSTQHPTETQHMVADALGIPQSSVVCVTKRLGGGFGGKETQAAPFAVYAAMVAKATGRAARLVLSKDDDMIMTGKRNPFQIDYTVGFAPDGRLLALDAQLFSDGGAYADLSTAIMERALLHSDNAYYLPSARVVGQVCRTNMHPHTAFRGFGGPKGVGMIESIMEDIAMTLGLDALDVRKRNCYQLPDRIHTHYEQEVENNMLPELFARLEESCDYRRRREAIERHNQTPGTHPRGMALTAVKFGISFTTRFLNQGNALVNVQRDGSIQVSSGAVEMGQGVNVRIAALVAEEFGIAVQRVRVMPTSTEKNANTSPTAASSGTDINGNAALIAAGKIKKRLSQCLRQILDLSPEQRPSKVAGLATLPEVEINEAATEDLAVFKEGKVFLKDRPDKALTFAELAAEAYFSRISLSDYGYYKTPDLSFNKLKGKGRAFHYFSQGVACSEVEIDRWTGEVKVLRSDITMDLGRPINLDLDLGQVSGAFIQGLGWMTTEALYYDAKGRLLSHSPSTYKIPSVHDIPRHFHIELLPNLGNTRNVRGTKAVGEPPLMLCFSVWNAIRDAIYSHERIRGRKGKVSDLPVPASAEAILRALEPEGFARFERSGR